MRRAPRERCPLAAGCLDVGLSPGPWLNGRTAHTGAQPDPRARRRAYQVSILTVIGRDEASGAVAEVHAKLTSPAERTALMKVIGVRAEQELRVFWFKRDAESSNKMGWPRQHFWARIAKRTAFDPSKTTEST